MSQPRRNQARPRYMPDPAQNVPRQAPYSARYSTPRTPPSQNSSWQNDSEDGAPPPKRHNVLWATIIFMCVLLLIGSGMLIASAYSGYDEYIGKRAIQGKHTILNGVYIDGIHVGGMTVDEARTMLKNTLTDVERTFSLSVNAAGTIYVINASNVPLYRNLETTVNEAYTIGRMNMQGLDSNGLTPFEYRYQMMDYVASQRAYLYTKITYDQPSLERCVDQITAATNREAVNAEITSFDVQTKQFTMTDETQGLQLDRNALLDELKSLLDNQQYSASVTALVETVMPAVTKTELRNNFSLIGSYSTKTTSNANRNTNIRLAAQALNGVCVRAGGTFTFNGTVGERTAAKGYMPAAAIAGGTTVDEIGGGVCQVSSTLFNAIALAGLDLVNRSPHAWPSSYIGEGRDATVNWPGLDFQFKNNQKTPIYIMSWYSDRHVYVEVYGMSLGAGVTVDLETRLISTTEPPTEPVYQFNAELPYGSEQELKKRRTGYVWETYRVYYRGGVEYAREKLCTSTYKAIQQVIEYNW